VSTKTDVSRSPIARPTRTAAVVESTPPEHAMMALPGAGMAFRISAICSSTNFAGSNRGLASRGQTRGRIST